MSHRVRNERGRMTEAEFVDSICCYGDLLTFEAYAKRDWLGAFVAWLRSTP